MATLTLIGEPFPDNDAAAHAEATRELTEAVAITAPRGCSARLLIGSEREAPVFSTARARVERLPMRSNMLPVLWRASMTARPLDGEFVHAPTPLVPLRSRDEDDGSQTSVMVPHALGWLAPELMGSSNARQYRAFVKRAVRRADVVVTPTHATATALYERYGGGITVQVIPVAAPRSYLRADDSAQRRNALGLPDRYLVTNATACDIGRLSWLFDALKADDELPPLVVLTALTASPVPEISPGDQTASAAEDAPSGKAGSDSPDPSQTSAPQTETPASSTTVITYGSGAARPREAEGHRPIAVPNELRNRVHIVQPRELADIGAVLSGAELLAVPQSVIGAGYEVLGALAAGVPVVHAGCAACAELALDAGIGAESAEDFAAVLGRLSRDATERQRLSVFAEDRSRTFTWGTTAQLLWELHANI